MRKKISDIYSKAFPKKGGEEYSTREIVKLMIGWTILLSLLFLLLKYLYDYFH
ncbi:MAG: hypothetical protein IPN22_14090 [Bacteroidetes bacterium]|nr:hypothetical protein [Bacteroidota bacterium]